MIARRRMRLLRQLVATLLLTALGQTVAAAQAPPASSPLPVAPLRAATRQNAFTIPFQIDAPPTPSEKAVEAILNVSTDQGTTWSISSRARPDKNSFVFARRTTANTGLIFAQWTPRG